MERSPSFNRALAFGDAGDAVAIGGDCVGSSHTDALVL
jgi:hypothetical protein